MRASLEIPGPALLATGLATAFAAGFAIRAPPIAPFDGPSMAAGENVENLKFVKATITDRKVSESERTIRNGRHCDS